MAAFSVRLIQPYWIWLGARIVESGTHEQLIAAGGVYAELVNRRPSISRKR